MVRDHEQLFLRALETAPLSGGRLTVLSSEPLDQQMLGDLAANLGEITFYATGLTLHKVDQALGKEGRKIADESYSSSDIVWNKPEGDYVLDAGKGRPPTYIAGTVPPAAASWTVKSHFLRQSWW